MIILKNLQDSLDIPRPSEGRTSENFRAHRANRNDLETPVEASLNKEVPITLRVQRLLQHAFEPAIIIVLKRTSWGVCFFSDRAQEYVSKYLGFSLPLGLPLEFVRRLERGVRRFEIAQPTGDLMTVRVRQYAKYPEFLILYLAESCNPGPASLNALKRMLDVTEREAQVLYWIAQGKTSSEIGIILGAAKTTIKKHVQNIIEKMGVENRLTAALRASAILRLNI